MPLDPVARAFLDQVTAMGLPPFHEQSVAAARDGIRLLAQMDGSREAVARVEDHTVPGPAGDVPVRLYAPATAGKPPVLVYFHGGGWVIGGIDTHDAVCRALANRAEAAVASIDYRLAPEHPFPAAVDDCYAATRWIAENAGTFAVDAERVAVGGDSAGGNLAAVVAQLARERGGPWLRHQVLVYPATDPAMDTPSYRENADGYLLTRAAMEWFYGHYLPDPADRTNPLAAPLRATRLGGLPPATVITAEFDPLRDEAEAYAERLREAGVPVDLARYDGMIHGFLGMTALFAQARVALDRIGAALRGAFE